MDNYVNLDYLRKKGFTKDERCAPANNRWEKADGKTHFVSSFWVSVALTTDGSRTKDGVILFYSSDGNGYIMQKRKFEGEITIGDFEKFLDRKCSDLPEFVKVFPS